MQQLQLFWRNHWVVVLGVMQGVWLALALISLVLILLAPPLSSHPSRSSATPAPGDAPCCCASPPASNGVAAER
jgi:hypothetical protein